ncbi:MAG: PIN domain-containing protein [Paracoccaceae bacterium]|jgi:predicted nucleic acid-binding protein
MRVLMDACILFPTVMREILIETAAAGGFAPLWSDKILDEWRHAAGRADFEVGGIAGVEIALLKANWPDAMVQADSTVIETLSLPDRNDRHVLAAAIAGDAEFLLTRNLKDFPTKTLARHDIIRREPDGFLMEFAQNGPVDMLVVGRKVQARAVRASGRPQLIRPLLKRTGLPRLGKFLEAEFGEES